MTIGSYLYGGLISQLLGLSIHLSSGLGSIPVSIVHQSYNATKIHNSIQYMYVVYKHKGANSYKELCPRLYLRVFDFVLFTWWIKLIISEYFCTILVWNLLYKYNISTGNLFLNMIDMHHIADLFIYQPISPFLYENINKNKFIYEKNLHQITYIHK